MGTNYYWTKEPCPTCGHGEELHIGKSSGGWTFGLHVYPEDGIRDLPDWEDRWDSGEIRNEYGEVVAAEEMRMVVLARAWKRTEPTTDRFYEENHAVPGPAGLVRSKIDGVHCVGHGSGTYDLIVGEFS